MSRVPYTMDNRTAKKTAHVRATHLINKAGMGEKNKTKKEISVAEDPRLTAIREFGERLQIKAEKVRLLTRAEEGLGDGEFNPYETMALPVDTIQHIAKIDPDPEPVIVNSSARQKRRSKQQGSHGSQRTNVNIKDYRPGYMWNKGGRVKELRIRTIARKFLQLWKKKVFGRVTPSAARAHYNRHILKMTFKTWHDMWWELRKEWRLEIRAECHHRYVLWKKTFRAWQNFVVKQKVKNTKKALAEQHCSVKLLRSCLDGWRMYIQARREKRRKASLALEHRNQQLARTYWRSWMTRYETRLHRQNMESIALQFWSYRIQAQHWLMWQRQMFERREASVNKYRAMRHHNTTLVHRCFQAWIVYRNIRQQKKQEKDYASLLYRRVLMGQMFGRWVEAYRFREALKERHERIEELADIFQKRRMFLHWRHYITLVHEKQQQVADAEDHYQRKLMSAGLSGFRLSVVQTKIKGMRQTMADQLRYKQMLRWAFTTWLSRCDNNEELRLIGQSKVARQHYRKVLLSRCFQQLQDYTAWRQHRKLQYAKADAHFYMQAMPEYLFRWKVFVNLMKTKQINAENCEEFRRENLLARFYYQWVNQYEFSKEYRMNERMAILHCDSTTRRFFFQRWKQRTAEAQRDADMEEMAIAHHNTCLLRQHLLAWTGYIHDLKTSQRQEVEAARYDRRQTQRKVWRAWTLYMRQRREKHRKTERAYNHYRRKICAKMITMWLHYVDTQRLIRERAGVMYARQCARRLKELFQQWRENVRYQLDEKSLEERAVIHHNQRLKIKVFTAWHRFAAIHAYKKSETRQWVESARGELDTKLLRLFFSKWTESFKNSRTERVKVSMAISFHDHSLKQKVMVAWQQFTNESIRKSLLQKQSDWFQNVRLNARYFIAWKEALAERQSENEKTGLALWHWSLTLNRKVLINWYVYVQERKQKKSRLADAMERRRCRLLKDGLTQWLAVADDMSAMRKRFAAQQQAMGAYQTYQLVLRCGLHWKHWALTRREARGLSKPQPGQLPMSTSAPSTFRGGHSMAVTPRSGTAVLTEQTLSQQVTPRSTTDSVQIPTKQPLTMTRSHIPAPKPNVFQACVKTQSRARPRRPDFLIESLKKAGLFSVSALNVETSQKPTKPSAVNQLPQEGEGHSVSRDPAVVERLNLSAMSSARSDYSVPFQHYSGSTRDREHAPNSSRLQPVENKLQPYEIAQDITSASTQMAARPDAQSEKQTYSEFTLGSHTDHTELRLDCPGGMEYRPVNADHNQTGRSYVTSVPGGVAVSSASSRSDTSCRQLQGDSLSRSLVPPHSAKPVLMTPADFAIQSKNLTTEPYANMRHIVDDNLTPRTLQELNIHSECQSVVSTPRVLCQNADHGHPLYETFSFKPGVFQGEVTPRSTLTTPRDEHSKLSSLGFESSQTSTKDIHKEIIVIRNCLKSFDQKKKKLRTMQKQWKQLRDWLTEMEGRGEGSHDDDVVNAQQEVKELTADIQCLQKSVEEEKIKCAGLVDRVKTLMAQLNTRD